MNWQTTSSFHPVKNWHCREKDKPIEVHSLVPQTVSCQVSISKPSRREGSKSSTLQKRVQFTYTVGIFFNDKVENLEREQPTAVNQLLWITEVFQSYKFPDIPGTENDCHNFSSFGYITWVVFWGDKNKSHRQQLCMHNPRHQNERDWVPGPCLGRAITGVTGELWTASQGYLIPPQESLSVSRGGEDPLSPSSHLLRKEEYPLIFFFSEMKAASFTLHILEDHCHLWHPQHRARSN